jgi:two-component system chemotaxis sensor kinase CheA
MSTDLSDFDADLLAQMREDFLTEAQEILDRLGPLLTRLEHDRSPDVINSIFREVHTLKGAAGFIGLTHLQRLAHGLEDTFGDVRAGKLGVTPALMDLTFDGLQLLATMRADAARGGKGEADIEPLLAQLDAARRRELILSPKKTGPLSPAPAPEAHPPEAEAITPSAPAAEATIRVDVETVDELLAMVGELITARNALNAIAERLNDEALRSSVSAVGRLTRQLQTLVMEARLVPVERLFNRFAPVVRNLARELGKPAQLVIEGGSTPFDRTVSEQMYDPLIHLIRNALDHGLEPAEERRRRGKPETGTIRLSAERRGDIVLLRVSDDGGGMEAARLRQAAVERDLLTAPEAEALTDDQAIRMIFAPGFSTAGAVTNLSGRGVGMDVVLQNVRRLRGSIDIETTPGQGTTFVVELPLTLAILHVLLARVGEQCYALPLHTVRETLLLTSEAIRTMQRREVTFLRGQPLPVRRLGEWLGQPSAANGPARPAIVVSLTRGPEVVVVDELLGKQQMVIKPLSPYLGAVDGVEGAAILPDGTVTLILDIEKLITA